MMSDSFAALIFAIVSAPIAIAGATALGYLLGKEMGAITLLMVSGAAASFCLFGALLGGWSGLLVVMFLATGALALVGGLLSGKRGAWCFSLVWLGWCLFSVFGYRAGYPMAYQRAYQKAYGVAYRREYPVAYREAYKLTFDQDDPAAGPQAGREWGQAVGQLAGRIAGQSAGQNAGRAAGMLGFILIALPSFALMGIGAYVLAPRLLPLGDKPSQADRLQALRALLTYTLGTNGPYYIVENRKATKRVSGDLFREFLAGPGIVMTGCDHAVVISDGIKIKGVKDPGVSFTGLFERIEEIIDLRVQLRAFDVEALTKDGLRIKVRTSVPFRIQAGSQWPEPNKPFPFRKSAVFNALRRQPVEHSHETQQGKVVESKQRLSWDEVVGIAATQVVRRIISTYSFDELYASYELQRDPRKEIVDKLQRQLKDELEPMGIQVVGGGVSNLLPVDDRLLQQRMDNWQAEWTRRTTAEMGKADAEYIRMIESARAQAQAEMIRTISEGLERAGAVDTTISTEVMALRFVEALEKMIASPAVQRALPSSAVQAVETMKHSIEGRPH